MDGRKIIQWSLGGLGIALVIGYSYFVIEDFVRGPRIVIGSPQTGFSTTTPVIAIVGRGIHTNNLTINGSQTAVDLEGNFRSQLILAPGYNIIKVTAKDNYERTVEKTIEMVLVVPEKEAVATTTPKIIEIHSASSTTNISTSTKQWTEGAVIN